MTSQPASTRTAIGMLLVVIIVWGSMWPINKLLLAYASPLWVTAGRLMLGALTLLLIGACTGRLAWPVRGDLPAILSVGLLHMGAFAVLTSIGLLYVPAGRSVVLAYTASMWVVPGAHWFLGEKASAARLAGLAIGIAGLIVIFNPWSFDWHDPHAVLGNGLIALAAICWAANIVYIRGHRWITPPFELTFWQALLASVLVGLMAVLWDGAPQIRWSREFALFGGFAGVIGTALAYWAMVTVNRALPATATSLGLLAVPVTGLTVSKLLLAEALDPALLAGTALILSGIALGSWPWWPPRTA
jgi:drug/metabolite transporter (DMT)-like permease